MVTPECQLGHFSECQLGHFSECQLGHFNNKVRDIREEDDDKANVVVVSSDVLPEKTMVGPRTDSTTDSHANDEIADVVAMFDGSPLAGLISPLSIREAVAAYDPSAHPDYQPESPLEGVRRMSSWILKMAAHPDMPVIRTPAGLLISLARRGMDKPAIVARQEASQEKYRMARQRDRYESFVLQLQKEYPGVNVADILATCVGSSYQMPTEEQLAKVREECRQARDRADAARDQAMAKFLRKHSDLKREMRR